MRRDGLGIYFDVIRFFSDARSESQGVGGSAARGRVFGALVDAGLILPVGTYGGRRRWLASPKAVKALGCWDRCCEALGVSA